MQKSMPCEELVGEASGRGGGNAKDLGGHQRIRNGFCMLKEQQKGLHDWNRVSEWGVIDASKITQTVACWRLVHDGIVLFSWDRKPPRTISVIWSNPFTQQVEWHNPREVNWFKKKKWKWSHLVMSDSLWPHGLYVAYQSPLPMGFSRQDYWNGLPFPSPGDLPNPGIEPRSLAM